MQRWCLLFLAIGLGGCQSISKSPLDKQLAPKDFKVLTEPAPPKPAPLVSVPKPGPCIPSNCYQKVSVYLSRDLSLGLVLERLANLLHMDVQIDRALYKPAHNISFSASDRPFIDVLENICSIANVRYRFEHGMLFIEEDTPFARSYNVQFLNLKRLSENKISSATDIFSHSVVQNGEASSTLAPSNIGENGSNTSVTMNSENDFWKELEANLQMLLTTNDEQHKPSFTMHKQAGIISVLGTAAQHHCVRSYLEALKKSVSSQILIEAKVIEVALRDEFKSGIDWGRLKPKADGSDHADFFYGGANLTRTLHDKGGGSPISTDIGNGFFQYTTQFENGLYGFIQALQKFGSTKTLSSPRVTVMNNQSAVLKVAKNHVYFKLNYNKHFYTKNDREDISVGSDIQTVPIGLVMSVQPAIDPSTNSVILFLRPTISRLAGTASDPSVSIANNNSENKNNSVPESQIPVVEVKEIDSVLRLKDGEVAVLGGLMESNSINMHNKAPVLGDMPVLKEVFSNTNRNDLVTEVVILIRVKILESPSPDAADERLAHLYMNDPRPIC